MLLHFLLWRYSQSTVTFIRGHIWIHPWVSMRRLRVRVCQFFLLRHIQFLIWQIELIIMLRSNIYKFVSKFGLFQSQNTFVDFLLQQFSSISIIHEFPHARSQKSLIIKLLKLLLCFILLSFSFFTFSLGWFNIFRFFSIWLSMKVRSLHKLLFYKFHSFHYWCWVTFFDDIDALGWKINLLLSSLPKNILCLLLGHHGLMRVLMSSSGRPFLGFFKHNSILLEDFKSSLRLGPQQKLIVCSLESLNNINGFRFRLRCVF